MVAGRKRGEEEEGGEGGQGGKQLSAKRGLEVFHEH